MSDFTPRLFDLDKVLDALDTAFLDHYTETRLVSLDAVKRVLIKQQLKEELTSPVVGSNSSLGKNKKSLLTTKIN